MKEVVGDLFEQEADAICITTNNIVRNGKLVMGAGVAKIAAQKWPDLPLKLGAYITQQSINEYNWNHVCPILIDNIAVVSFPVKWEFWKDADINLIERSCKELADNATFYKWNKVVLPKPGCGAGNLTWDQVKPICEKYFDDRFIIVDKR